MSRKGFTLIELMIVVAIIAIIAAVAIPSLLASRATANETRVIAFLRAYSGGMITYRNHFSVYTYFANRGIYDTDPPYVNDPGLVATSCPCTSGGGPYCPFSQGGYHFFGVLSEWYGPTYQEGGYEIFAWPNAPGQSGRRAFYITEEGVVRGGMLSAQPTGCFTDGSDSNENLFRSFPPIDG